MCRFETLAHVVDEKKYIGQGGKLHDGRMVLRSVLEPVQTGKVSAAFLLM